MLAGFSMFLWFLETKQGEAPAVPKRSRLSHAAVAEAVTLIGIGATDTGVDTSDLYRLDIVH